MSSGRGKCILHICLLSFTYCLLGDDRELSCKLLLLFRHIDSLSRHSSFILCFRVYKLSKEEDYGQQNKLKWVSNYSLTLIVSYKHHKIKSQSLIHIINFLLETSCDFECIANNKEPLSNNC